MMRDGGRSEPELRELLERGRAIPRLPDVVRARALARARARATVGAAASDAFAPAIAARGRWLRLAVAASLVLVVGVAGAAVGLRGRTLDRTEPTFPSNPRAVPEAPITAPNRPRVTLAAAPQLLAKAKPRPGRPVTPQESYAAELALLQRAQVAYKHRNFPGAMVLVGEHARQFPNGRLAEEREALRARSLAGSGRTEEARRAVAAFAARFPRSVLLPRLRETTAAGE